MNTSNDAGAENKAMFVSHRLALHVSAQRMSSCFFSDLRYAGKPPSAINIQSRGGGGGVAGAWSERKDASIPAREQKQL